MIPRKYKKECVSCRRADVKMNHEHFWPQWLIDRTGTNKTGVRFDGTKRINPRKLKVPLCVRCNSDFGNGLETPVSILFNEIEAGRGISDEDAEVLVRWLWKFEGLYW